MNRTVWTTARAVTLAMCAAVAGVTAMDLLAMEAGGGRLTGLLGKLCLAGSALFLVAAALTIWRAAAASFLAGVAALACLPLYLYLLAPASMAWLSSAPSSVAVPAGLVFNPDAVLGVLLLAATAAVHALPRRRADAGPAARD